MATTQRAERAKAVRILKAVQLGLTEEHDVAREAGYDPANVHSMRGLRKFCDRLRSMGLLSGKSGPNGKGYYWRLPRGFQLCPRCGGEQVIRVAD